MTCKQYQNRDIIYYCEAKRKGDRWICNTCQLDEPFQICFNGVDYTTWEDLPQEKRDEIMDNAKKRLGE